LVGLSSSSFSLRLFSFVQLVGLALPPPGREPITYFHIYECADFTVGIFCIPKGESMPIHDHPDMTVCSKVLYGKVHVEAYDKAPDLQVR